MALDKDVLGLFSVLFQSLRPWQHHEAAPFYQQPIKASEIQAEHFDTFSIKGPACLGRRC